jgi:hypothetical protein
MAELAVPRQMFADILMLIARLLVEGQTTMGEVRLDEAKATGSNFARGGQPDDWLQTGWFAIQFHCGNASMRRKIALNRPRIRGNVG